MSEIFFFISATGYTSIDSHIKIAKIILNFEYPSPFSVLLRQMNVGTYIEIRNQTYGIEIPSRRKCSPIPRLEFTINFHQLVSIGSVEANLVKESWFEIS